MEGTCSQDRCFVGINQSYDDLWIAYNHTTKEVAPHLQYNSWANTWEVSDGTTQLTIVYIPQVVSLFGMVVLVLTVLYLIRVSIANSKREAEQAHTKKVRSRALHRLPKRVLAGAHSQRKKFTR